MAITFEEFKKRLIASGKKVTFIKKDSSGNVIEKTTYNKSRVISHSKGHSIPEEINDYIKRKLAKGEDINKDEIIARGYSLATAKEAINKYNELKKKLNNSQEKSSTKKITIPLNITNKKVKKGQKVTFDDVLIDVRNRLKREGVPDWKILEIANQIYEGDIYKYNKTIHLGKSNENIIIPNKKSGGSIKQPATTSTSPTQIKNIDFFYVNPFTQQLSIDIQQKQQQKIPTIKQLLGFPQIEAFGNKIREEERRKDKLVRKWHPIISKDIQNEWRKSKIKIDVAIKAISTAINEPEIAYELETREKALNEKASNIKTQKEKELNIFQNKLKFVQEKYIQEKIQSKLQNIYETYIKKGFSPEKAKEKALTKIKSTPEYQALTQIIQGLSQSKINVLNKGLQNIKLTDQDFKNYLKRDKNRKKEYFEVQFTKTLKNAAVTFFISKGIGEIFGGVTGTLKNVISIKKATSSTKVSKIVWSGLDRAYKGSLITFGLGASAFSGWEYGKSISIDIKKKDYFSIVSKTTNLITGFGGFILGAKKGFSYTQQSKFQPWIEGKTKKIFFRVENKDIIETKSHNIDLKNLPSNKKIFLQYKEELPSGEVSNTKIFIENNNLLIHKKIGNVEFIKTQKDKISYVTKFLNGKIKYTYKSEPLILNLFKPEINVLYSIEKEKNNIFNNKIIQLSTQKREYTYKTNTIETKIRGKIKQKGYIFSITDIKEGAKIEFRVFKDKSLKNELISMIDYEVKNPSIGKEPSLDRIISKNYQESNLIKIFKDEKSYSSLDILNVELIRRPLTRTIIFRNIKSEGTINIKENKGFNLKDIFSIRELNKKGSITITKFKPQETIFEKLTISKIKDVFSNERIILPEITFSQSKIINIGLFFNFNTNQLLDVNNNYKIISNNKIKTDLDLDINTKINNKIDVNIIQAPTQVVETQEVTIGNNFNPKPTKYDLVLNNSISLTPSEPKLEIPITPIEFKFPSFDFNFEKLKSKNIPAKQNKKYTPSLSAVLLNISGDIPKTLTGFEIRPIPHKKKRKKRR